MPIIKSAKKRVKVARKATVRNAKTKRTLKTALKSFHSSLTGGSHAKAQSALDKAAKKGVLHKNKVARKKKQLAKAAKAAGVKTTGTVKKTAKKATPAKKAAPKKTVAKKAPAKKPAAKKK
jgi:small subunit ribosomal protein S20